jgi:hypothetical protein
MKENSPSSFLSAGMTPAEAITAQVEVYQKASRACGHKLLNIYTDLGLSQDEQHKELNDVAVKACHTWSEAVEDAESKRTALRLKIDEIYKETQKMKCQLGDSMHEDDCQSLIVRHTGIWNASCMPNMDVLAAVTLQSEEVAVHDVSGGTGEAGGVEGEEGGTIRRILKASGGICKQAGGPCDSTSMFDRMLQGDVNRLKTQLGLHVMPATRQPDISRSNMDYLQLEFEQLTDTKVRTMPTVCSCSAQQPVPLAGLKRIACGGCNDRSWTYPCMLLRALAATQACTDGMHLHAYVL